MSDLPWLWSVQFRISEHESRPLTDAYVQTADGTTWGAEFGGWLKDSLEPHPYFLVYVKAPDANAASKTAIDQLARMRTHCGLGSQPSVPEWTAPVTGPDGLRFMSQAKELYEGENFELAVVAAQIHLEHQARLILGVLGQRPGAPRWALGLAKGGYGPLHRPGGLAVIEMLTGQDLMASKVWSDYAAHVRLRNQIAHEGASATRAEALRSIKAVQAVWLALTASLRST